MLVVSSDTAVLSPPMMPGEAFDVPVIGDHADGFVEFDGVAVQQLERLALACPSALRCRRGSCRDRTRASGGRVRASRNSRYRRARKCCAGPSARAARPSIAASSRARSRRGSRGPKSGRTGRAPGSSPAAFRRASASTGGMSSALSGAPVIAAVSRATPNTDRQSALFGVSLISKTVSSRLSVSRMSWPIGVSAGRISKTAVIFRQLQLARRAQHALALDAAQLRQLDRERLAARFRRRQLRADERDRHLDARRHIRRAAHDVELSRPCRHRPDRR